ncbi:MAG: SusD/RagB family nutrient-binding outer membrane lipoprotein [Williamsia sp.]|nr:SusD/RagB family nutrient-binding outer membrane lipoprotein [Williamsia sp.]
MKMHMFNRILFLSLTVFLVAPACKRQLDINVDPNNPTFEQGTPKLVFPAAVIATAGRTGGDLAILGGIWGQYVTQAALSNQYKFIDAYDVKNTDLNAQYSGLFAGGIKNYQFVINKARDAKDWNFYLMATVMKAYTTEVLVDLYDQIPYTEALQGANNLNPKFDDGYTIYKDLLANLDSALSKDFSASTNTILAGTSSSSVDLVFNGNMDNWKRFANTLELKMYLRMINAKPDEAKAGVQKLYARNATFLTTNAAVASFIDATSRSNPLYEQNIRQLNTPDNLRASRTFVSFLQAKGDPRIVTYFGSATAGSINQGDYASNDASYRTAAVFVEKPTDPVIFLSAAESYLLQAEARERYYNGDQSKALYNSGVLAAFTAAGQNGSTSVATGGAYEYPAATAILEQKIEAISVQKWVSCATGVHMLEGYFEKNRTGYPRTSTVYSSDPAYVPGQFVVSKNTVLTGSQLPKRLVFPDVEKSRNSNTPAQVPITTPVWWAK